jgi:hypothetical protein
MIKLQVQDEQTGKTTAKAFLSNMEVTVDDAVLVASSPWDEDDSVGIKVALSP